MYNQQLLCKIMSFSHSEHTSRSELLPYKAHLQVSLKGLQLQMLPLILGGMLLFFFICFF